MAQGVLPYKYEEDKTNAGLTALAGLPVYLDPGRIIEHARGLIIRLVRNHPSFALLIEARQRIMRLAPS